MPDEAKIIAREREDLREALQAAHAAWDNAVGASLDKPDDKRLVKAADDARARAAKLMGQYHDAKLRGEAQSRRDEVRRKAEAAVKKLAAELKE